MSMAGCWSIGSEGLIGDAGAANEADRNDRRADRSRAEPRTSSTRCSGPPASPMKSSRSKSGRTNWPATSPRSGTTRRSTGPDRHHAAQAGCRAIISSARPLSPASSARSTASAATAATGSAPISTATASSRPWPAWACRLAGKRILLVGCGGAGRRDRREPGSGCRHRSRALRHRPRKGVGLRRSSVRFRAGLDGPRHRRAGRQPSTSSSMPRRSAWKPATLRRYPRRRSSAASLVADIVAVETRR